MHVGRALDSEGRRILSKDLRTSNQLRATSIGTARLFHELSSSRSHSIVFYDLRLCAGGEITVGGEEPGVSILFFDASRRKG